MICENCGTEHSGKYGSGRFCCQKCARGFSTKRKRKEINEKVSSALKGRSSALKGRSSALKGRSSNFSLCKRCNAKIEKKKRFCSSCITKSKSEGAKKAFQNVLRAGKFKGWQVRKSGQSYAEKYFENYLIENKISGYTKEFKVGVYFIDFAFYDKMIAIEIDGKQHEQEDRKESDKRKDLFLTQSGWSVRRVKWKDPRKNKNYLLSRFKLVLQGVA